MNKNQEDRAKFPDEPMKFIDSEIELQNQLFKMQLLATAPDMYLEIVFNLYIRLN